MIKQFTVFLYLKKKRKNRFNKVFRKLYQTFMGKTEKLRGT